MKLPRNFALVVAAILAAAWYVYAVPERKPDIAGSVDALGEAGQMITVISPPPKAGADPTRRGVKISLRTMLVYEKTEAPLRVGQSIEVWLERGSPDQAMFVRLRPPGAIRSVKPAGDSRFDPRFQGAPREQPGLRAYVAPKRAPGPVAAMLDAAIDQQLREQKVTASGPADDVEFLRRVTLDLTGRVPSHARTVAFLASTDPNKRRALIEDLLAGGNYSEHFATIWRNLIVPRDDGVKTRPGRDGFALWLADQFAKNHGWDKIVSAMLTAEGSLAKEPATMFTLAHTENAQPQPARLADTAARLFWGIQLRCAECHDHPFAQWKQTDFWATAAFFSKLRQGGTRGEAQVVTEAANPEQGAVRKGAGQPAPAGAIAIPGSAGKNKGQMVTARFLGGIEPDLDKDGPYRPRFAAWATASDNPYFARAAVNRWWAHFFGRGLVEPLDGFDESNEPSHPELLDKLAREFTDSGFDVQHLCRVIVNSNAYQRTSRPSASNADDKRSYSHMAVRPLSPEVLYNAIMVVTEADGVLSVESRAVFATAFQPLPESAGVADTYDQGVPQVLKLLNAPLLNRGAPIVNTLAQSEKTAAQAIETLYLAALSRRPTADETRLMSVYLERQTDKREGYAGILWILLNTSEFALNH